MQRYLIFPLVILLNSSSFLLKAEDTEIKQLTEKMREAFLLASTNPFKGLEMAKEGLREALNNKDKFNEGSAYNTLGWNYFRLGHRDSAALFFEKGYISFLDVSEEEEAARVAYNYAEMLTAENKYNLALSQLVLADSLLTASKNTGALGSINRLKAILFREQQDFRQSEKFFRLSMKQFLKGHDTARYVDATSSLAILYSKMKRYKESISLFDSCMVLVGGGGRQMASLHENLGDTYFQMTDFRKALQHFKLSYDLFLAQQQQADVAFMAMAVGRANIELGNFREAEYFLLRSFELNDSLRTTNYIVDAAMELSKLYQRMAKWKLAFTYLNEANEIRDSLRMAEQLKEVTAMQAKYEAEKKELAYNDLQVQHQRTRWIQFLVIGLFVMTICCFFLLFNRYKIARRLREQEVRNRIAADLHDDIGASLSGINLGSSIALLKKDHPELVMNQLMVIQKQSKQTIEQIADLVWAINPINDSVEQMVLRLKDFAATLLASLDIDYEFKEIGLVDLPKCDAAVRKNVYLVAKEALNNAVKYSEASKITICVAYATECLALSVKDNGRGFTHDSTTVGNGLRNMRVRMQEIGGELTVYSTSSGGTSIEAMVKIA